MRRFTRRNLKIRDGHKWARLVLRLPTCWCFTFTVMMCDELPDCAAQGLLAARPTLGDVRFSNAFACALGLSFALYMGLLIRYLENMSSKVN